MENNDDVQDELLALASIYDCDKLVLDEIQRKGTFLASQDLPIPFSIISRAAKDSALKGMKFFSLFCYI